MIVEVLLKIFSEGLIWANVLIAGCIAYLSSVRVYEIWRRSGGLGVTWSFRLFAAGRGVDRLLDAIIGLYWLGLYLFVGLNNLGFWEMRDQSTWSITWVRPMFTFTLAIMASRLLRSIPCRKKDEGHSNVQ